MIVLCWDFKKNTSTTSTSTLFSLTVFKNPFEFYTASKQQQTWPIRLWNGHCTLAVREPRGKHTMSNLNRKSKTYPHSTLDLAAHSRHSSVGFKNHCSHSLSQTCYSDLFSMAYSSVKHYLMFTGLSHAPVFEIWVACFIVADSERHSSSIRMSLGFDKDSQSDNHSCVF